MDNQENTAHMPPATQGATDTPPLDAKGAARRRFTRIGAGATGVILTLHSQPGMAAGGACVSPSGFMSMTATSNRPQVSCSANRSHGYWKTHPEEWRTRAGIDYNAPFGKVFLATGRYADLAKVPLMQVVDPNDAVKAIDRNNVAMQCVAALLNARAARYTGIPSVLTEERVMEIWTSYVTKGFYAPAGEKSMIWTAPQIAGYLETTFR
jgi:hypothetical protein